MAIIDPDKVATIVDPDEVQPKHEFSVANMAVNIPGSAFDFGKDIYQTVRHPVDAVTGLYSVIKGFGDLSEGLDTEDAKKASAVKDFFYDRYGYGDWEKIKKTLENDPVGFAADVSTVLGGGAGALKGAAKAVGKGAKAASAAGKLSSDLKTLGNFAEAGEKYTNPMSLLTAAPDALRTSTAKNLYKSAMKSEKLEPAHAASLTEIGLNEKIPISEKLKKVDGVPVSVGGTGIIRQRLESIGKELKQIFKDKPIYEGDILYSELGKDSTLNPYLKGKKSILLDKDGKIMLDENGYFVTSDVKVDPKIIAHERQMIDGRRIIEKLEELKKAETDPRLRLSQTYNKAYDDNIKAIKGKMNKDGLIEGQVAQDIKVKLGQDLKKSYEKDYETSITNKVDRSVRTVIKDEISLYFKDGIYVNEKTGDIISKAERSRKFKDGVVPEGWTYKDYPEINRRYGGLKKLQEVVESIVEKRRGRSASGGLTGNLLSSTGIGGAVYGIATGHGAIATPAGLAVALSPIVKEIITSPAFKSKLAIALGHKPATTLVKTTSRAGKYASQVGKYLGGGGLLGPDITP